MRISATLFSCCYFVQACGLIAFHQDFCKQQCRPGWVCIDGACAEICQSHISTCPEGQDCNVEVGVCRPKEKVCGVDDVQTRICGLNDAGEQSRACEDGSWGEWSSCDDDTCVNGEDETRLCGLNDEGTQSRTCESGRWLPWASCSGTDVCQSGTSGFEPCGINQSGIRTTECVAGQWVRSPECVDDDVCENGIIKKETCGTQGAGSRERICANGQWPPWGPCCVGDRLLPSERVFPAEYLCSANREHVFGLDEARTIVFFSAGVLQWSFATQGGAYLRMQVDGNLVLRDDTNSPVWASQTGKNDGAFLTVKDDGVVAIELNGGILWSI